MLKRIVTIILLLACISLTAYDLKICSFNIQFLGHFKKRNNTALADIMKPYDIVVIQELVAPPYDGFFPDHTKYKPDNESFLFFEEMRKNGFKYILSKEDTGRGEKNHKNSTATEWFVAFYKPDRVSIALDLPHGFIAEDRTANENFERVPYAFSFRENENKFDFVLISVHLKPNPGKKNEARRKQELSSIAKWIDNNDDTEKDFIIIGDMNIEGTKELNRIIPAGYMSLNNECRDTVTSKKDAPYDHIMFRKETSNELDLEYDMQVIDLIKVMRQYYDGDNYPGEPYNHNKFKMLYSDHNPIIFKTRTPVNDDD